LADVAGEASVEIEEKLTDCDFEEREEGQSIETVAVEEIFENCAMEDEKE
jgi:hypothetical protein